MVIGDREETLLKSTSPVLLGISPALIVLVAQLAHSLITEFPQCFRRLANRWLVDHESPVLCRLGLHQLDASSCSLPRHIMHFEGLVDVVIL